ncbi:MAG: hypothetical protein AAF693_14890 [Bacteroidota bacterium]
MEKVYEVQEESYPTVYEFDLEDIELDSKISIKVFSQHHKVYQSDDLQLDELGIYHTVKLEMDITMYPNKSKVDIQRLYRIGEIEIQKRYREARYKRTLLQALSVSLAIYYSISRLSTRWSLWFNFWNIG